MLLAAQNIHDESAKGKAVSGLARAFAQVGDQDGFEKALKALSLIKDGWPKTRELGFLAQALARVGLKPEAIRVIDQALVTATKSQDEPDKAEALCAIAYALSLVEDQENLRLILDSAQGLQNEADQSKALSGVAQAFAQFGDQKSLDLALDVIRSIKDDEFKVEALNGVAQLLAQAKYREGLRLARVIVQTIPNDYQPEAFTGLAQALARTGDVNQAFALTDEIPYPDIRTQALVGVSQWLALGDNQAGAWEAIHRALQTAQAIEDEEGKPEPLNDVVQMLAQLRDQEGMIEALAIAQGIQDQENKSNALLQVVVAMIQMEDLPGAIEVASTIPQGLYQVAAFRNISQALAHAGKEQLAKQSADKAFAEVLEIQEDNLKASALGEIAPAYALLKDDRSLTRALMVAKKIQDLAEKAWALNAVGLAIATVNGHTEGLSVFPSLIKTAVQSNDCLYWLYYYFNEWIPILSAIDGGEILIQTFEEMMAVEHWWGV